VKRIVCGNALFVCYVLRETMVAMKEIFTRKNSEK
jgi:hypothetical protein